MHCLKRFSTRTIALPKSQSISIQHKIPYWFCHGNSLDHEIMCEMIIDRRETELLKHIKHSQSSYVHSSTLDIGDVHYRLNNKTVYIVERKTVSDVACSIKDGRWREQKMRLRKCLHSNINIIYLIEGHLNSNACMISGIPLNTIMAAQSNTIIRDKMHVYRTNSLEESVMFLLNIQAKLKEHHKQYMDHEIDTLHYVDGIQLCKKDNLDKYNCNTLQLAQIPGVSMSMAKQIMFKYKSMKQLYDAYWNVMEEKDKELLLYGIKYPTEEGKQHKIGKCMSKRIYEYLN